ncbi:MAG: type II secretion system F family protein [Candidatus Diapherotrites archaeon]|nr:type II secretion system F family protein [Candidatus Diapherotrites archaeon]
MVTDDEKKDKKLIKLIAGEKKTEPKGIRRIGTSSGITPTYKETSVEDIVSRMEKKYKERGILEEGGVELTKGEELKEMVVGVTPLQLDRRTPDLLVHESSPFLRFVGSLYSTIKPLNSLNNDILTMSISESLPVDLNKANIPYSSKQFASVALVVTIIATVFMFFLTTILSLTLLSPIIDISIGALPQPVPILLKITLSGLFSFVSGAMVLVIALKYPVIVAGKRKTDIERILPFALRQMATEIKSGIGIHGSLKSIVRSNYGALSEEFERVLKDIEKGKSTEDALDELVLRSPSESLATAGIHMIRAIRTGGNLSDVIYAIADEVAFRLRMKMQEFVSKLNLVSLIYMMVGVIFPVLVAVLASVFTAVPTLGLGSAIGPEMLFMLYFVLIPAVLGVILYFIKAFQPM